ALYELARARLLPEQFALMAFSRHSLDDESFRRHVRAGLEKHARSRPIDEAVWQPFASRIECLSGSDDDPKAFARVRERLAHPHARFGTRGNQLYYLSTPASAYTTLLAGLSGAGLLPRQSAAHAEPWHRLIIEKPFGRDLASAQALDRALWET